MRLAKRFKAHPEYTIHNEVMNLLGYGDKVMILVDGHRTLQVGEYEGEHRQQTLDLDTPTETE